MGQTKLPPSGNNTVPPEVETSSHQQLRDHSCRYSASLHVFFAAIACDMVGRCNYIVSGFTRKKFSAVLKADLTCPIDDCPYGKWDRHPKMCKLIRLMSTVYLTATNL